MSDRETRVLVTGAGGMLGSALCEVLAVRSGFQLVAVYRRKPQRAIAQHWREIGDMGPETDWRQAVAGRDAVVHCAARAHVLREVSGDPMADFHRINVEASLALARQAMDAGVRQFVFISSAGVHGTANDVPAVESDSLSPVEPYAISKLIAEERLRELVAGSSMALTILRPPLIIGPRARGNMARLTKLALSSLPLPLGALHNSRSFVGVGNLCDAIITCLGDSRSAGRTYLVTDQVDMSTPDLIRAIAAAAGSRPLMLPVPLPLLKMAATLVGQAALLDKLAGSLRFESRAISTELGWQPPLAVAYDVARMVRWFAGKWYDARA